MDKNEYIDRVLSHIKDRNFVNTIKIELENHLADREEYYTEIGYSAEISAQKAVEHMGDADKLGENMNLLHSYRKHKIICVTGLAVLMVLTLTAYFILWLFDTSISNFFSDETQITAILVFSAVTVFLECMIYRYALASRNKVVIFLSGVTGILACSGFHGLFLPGFILPPYGIASALYYIFITVSVLNCIMCLTCSGEVSALIKGKGNSTMLKRYERYATFLLISTILFITAVIGLIIYLYKG